MQLGDVVERALEKVGITPERVAHWLRRECGGCKSRKDKLNQLGFWAASLLKGRTTGRHLEDMMED